jgi:hypothetical protein
VHVSQIVAEQQKKTETAIAELVEQQKKTETAIAELVEQQKKTDIQITEPVKPETDIWAKIEELIEDFDEGDSAEEFFYRSLLDNAYLGDMHFDTIYRNLPSCKGKLQDEFDVVLVNENSVAIVEIKQKAHPNLIDDMLNRKLPNFRTLFPYHQEQKLYGVIASMVSNDTLIEKAREAGLFCLTQRGQHVVLVNEEVKAF